MIVPITEYSGNTFSVCCDFRTTDSLILCCNSHVYLKKPSIVFNKPKHTLASLDGGGYKRPTEFITDMFPDFVHSGQFSRVVACRDEW